MNMRYKKRPIVIEAMQWDGTTASAVNILNWAKQDWRFNTVEYWNKIKPQDNNISITIVIPTLEGDLHASANDWIIKGVAGEFYPCKPDIFQKTYERVEE